MVNQMGLRKLVSDNEYVENIFNYILAVRYINRNVVRFDLFKRQVEEYLGESMDRSRLLRAFRMLENEGAGHLIKGSRGYPTRFQWDDSGMISLAQIALGLEGEEDECGEDDVDEALIDTYLHVFQLRNDYEFEIELPANLNEEEADRIADIISGLTVSHTQPDGIDVRVYNLPLRDGFDFELELPVDLSSSESWRLRNYINALPISSDCEDDDDIFDFDSLDLELEAVE